LPTKRLTTKDVLRKCEKIIKNSIDNDEQTNTQTERQTSVRMAQVSFGLCTCRVLGKGQINMSAHTIRNDEVGARQDIIRQETSGQDVWQAVITAGTGQPVNSIWH